MDNAKVLIVEDEILVARDLQMRLTKSGYSVPSVATTGMKAIQIVKEEHPDIVLMDIVLQDRMDGIETAEIIHSQFDIPVIYLTAHGDNATFEKAKKTFPYGYIIKPFSNDDINKTIQITLYKLRLEKERKKLIEQLRKEISERKHIEDSLRKRTETIINQQKVLLELSKQNFSDLVFALKKIAEVDAETLNVERVGIWFFNNDCTELFCKELYSMNKDILKKREAFQAKNYPDYFKALSGNRTIAANDACNDPRTREFSKEYLEPFGITSILDVPIRLQGKIVGIVCHYHTGSIREWTREEQDFAASIADMVSLAMETYERQKIEGTLLRSEKLKAMGVITSGIAHEFNNILAIISGNVQLLERRFRDHKQLSEALQIIRRATNDGAEISNRMLKFTKIKKDTKGFELCNLKDLIIHAINFTLPQWKNMAQVKGVNYRMEKKDMQDVPSILCNPTELREVFTNIINNALDAMPDGGSISFSTWSIENDVFVSIRDIGEGMSEEVKKNIFDPFFTTKLPMGSGLGMSTAYGIITRHGGKIAVESEKGKGTIFTLQFQAGNKVDNIEELPEPEQNIQSKSLNILVVDDEVGICKLLNEFLSEKNHKVKTVDNGTDAIKLLSKEHFDLVLCDLLMPDVNGYDVIKALDNLDKKPKIGIITGWAEKLDLLKEENMKVDLIAKKPFNFSELTRQINSLGI